VIKEKNGKNSFISFQFLPVKKRKDKKIKNLYFIGE
jgi:hypothetical protein